MSAAARGVEPEDIAGTQRVVGVACGEALRRGGVRVDPEAAGGAVAAAGAAVRGDEMLHGADRKACIREIEVFAADAEPAAELARPAGIRYQLEAREAGRKIALDDLDHPRLVLSLMC